MASLFNYSDKYIKEVIKANPGKVQEELKSLVMAEILKKEPLSNYEIEMLEEDISERIRNLIRS